MNDLTRRNAVKLLAGGSVLASSPMLGAAPPAIGALAAATTPPAIPDAAWEATTGTTPAATSPVLLARVARCRSWDTSVYLVAPGLRGYAQLTPQAFALAAACQAAGRPVAMRHGGHDPRWAQDSGLFRGVVLAIDAKDLDPEGDSWQ